MLSTRLAILILVFSPVITGQTSRQAGDSVILKDFLVEGNRPNFLEGDVEHVRGSDAAALTLNHAFKNGDVIRVGPSGRAEVLLVPGCYLRLDHNTHVALLDLSPDNLKLKVWSGSVILEVAIVDRLPGNDWEEQRKQLSYEPVSLLTPTAQYFVASGGSYRLKVDDKGSSELSLLKGIAFVNGSRVDSGMTASAAEGRVTLTSSAQPRDDFDSWSLQRGKALVKANHALEKSHWHKKVRSNRAYLSITDPEDPSRARERLTVSAETGVAGIVEDAFVTRAETPTASRKLQTSERLTNGDRVKTAVDSRAEIHVYPNCFLYLDGDTEIVYREVEQQVAVEIIKGSAIVILAPDPKATEAAVLTIVADKSEYRISEKGNYRLNVRAGGKPELMVYVGPTRVAEAARSKKTQPETMLKKLTGDSFDLWAYRRSRLLEVRDFRRYLGPLGGMWCLVESTGEYTFVPAVVEYRSPYGGTYSTTYGEPSLYFQRRRATPGDPFPPPRRPTGP